LSWLIENLLASIIITIVYLLSLLTIVASLRALPSKTEGLSTTWATKGKGLEMHTAITSLHTLSVHHACEHLV
jgi:hypothetical protein